MNLDRTYGSSQPRPTRRQFAQFLAGLGIGSTVFQRALAAEAAKTPGVTADMIRQAEWVAGLTLKDDDRKTLTGAMNRSVHAFEEMRAVPLANDVPLALTFQPAPWLAAAPSPDRSATGDVLMPAPQRPTSDEELAFLPVTSLAALIRTRQVTATELTKLYLRRLRQYDPVLFCVVTLTEDLALKQAERADREIAAGNYRGPLHGIPWGAKDLIAYPGYPTSWGATPFKDQKVQVKATVARRLEDAGAVLVAKLSLGALAMNDRWFRGMTRNPWNPKEGSSGSSAGSASATAAGLVGFALGSETLGSIISPCVRCGATGLRPTFGRVSRHGCMTLAWSMDKIGPIARSVEDTALVLQAIHGFDGLDAAAVDRPFSWPARRDLASVRVGYVEAGKPVKDRPELAVLRDLGVQLVPIKLPDKYPVSALQVILTAEAAAAFDDLTRQGITEGLNAWPQIFRNGEFIPAVSYLRANRIRSLLMREMEAVLAPVDLYVGGNDLLITNLTGHPTVVMPNGFRNVDGVEVPRAITFTGKIYGETDLLNVAHAYQRATGFQLPHPDLSKALAPGPEKKK